MGITFESVVEVAAELVFGHHRFQVTMGRRYQANVHLRRPCAPQALEFPVLQNAQQFGLEFQGDIPHFVQKQRPSVGHLQPAQLLGGGPGDGAPLVPKQFTLQQAAGDGRAIELDQESRLPVAAEVEGAGDEFLARTGLSQQEYGRIARGHHLNLFQDVPESCILTDDAFELRFTPDLFFQTELISHTA